MIFPKRVRIVGPHAGRWGQLFHRSRENHLFRLDTFRSPNPENCIQRSGDAGSNSRTDSRIKWGLLVRDIYTPRALTPIKWQKADPTKKSINT